MGDQIEFLVPSLNQLLEHLGSEPAYGKSLSHVFLVMFKSVLEAGIFLKLLTANVEHIKGSLFESIEEKKQKEKEEERHTKKL